MELLPLPLACRSVVRRTRSMRSACGNRRRCGSPRDLAVARRDVFEDRDEPAKILRRNAAAILMTNHPTLGLVDVFTGDRFRRSHSRREFTSTTPKRYCRCGTACRSWRISPPSSAAPVNWSPNSAGDHATKATSQPTIHRAVLTLSAHLFPHFAGRVRQKCIRGEPPHFGSDENNEHELEMDQ